MDDLINKTVLFDYFAGRTTPLQNKAVEQWLAHPTNQNLYYQWLHEWELSHLQMAPDWSAAFETLTHRLDERAVADAVADEPRTGWWPLQYLPQRTWVAAATVLLLLGVGGWFYRDTIRYCTERTHYGELRTLTLPDGSTVVLNANSTLRYPRFGFRRVASSTGLAGLVAEPGTVYLTGEANFSVTHLPTHQDFVVKTPKGLTITVLGTRFTVYSRPQRTHVVLQSGRVRLSMGQSQRLLRVMQPGDVAQLNPTEQAVAMTHTPTPETYSAWQRHRFVFEQTSLREVADLLRDNYGLTVTLATDALSQRTISGSFSARNADEIVQLVAELLQINYHRTNDHVTFTE